MLRSNYKIYQDAIYQNTQGFITSGTTFNLFMIKNDILLDKPEKPVVRDFGPEYVEYYFDLLVDSEIDNEVYFQKLIKE